MFLAGGFLAGCGDSPPTVRIGYTGPLSGGGALYGKNALAGLEMAERDINESGGIEVAGKEYRVELPGAGELPGVE